MDSELVVSQVKGLWKIKNERLRALAARAEMLLGKFDSYTLDHVRREKNADADALANQGMDQAELDIEDEPEQGSFL
jgi:ribonuclease HI